MQSDEPITLSDSTFSRHRDIRRDFLFIREITYRWIFVRSGNKSGRVIKCPRDKMSPWFSVNLLCSEISLPTEISFAIFVERRTWSHASLELNVAGPYFLPLDIFYVAYLYITFGNYLCAKCIISTKENIRRIWRFFYVLQVKLYIVS